VIFPDSAMAQGGLCGRKVRRDRLFEPGNRRWTRRGITRQVRQAKEEKFGMHQRFNNIGSGKRRFAG
jgi:hypothetical protein